MEAKMKTIQESIDIAAAPEKVWEILLDFAAYSDWNPFITSIAGTPREGERLKVRIKPPGGMAMTFAPRVLEAEAPRILRWLGKLGISGVFDGEHKFQIENAGNGTTRFTQSEAFAGLLVPLMAGTLSKTAEGFRQMNAALKQRSESS